MELGTNADAEAELASAFLSLDSEPEPQVLEDLCRLDTIEEARLIRLGQ
jgi:hypothetical protein